MGAGASTEKSAQERKSYGNLAGAVVSAKALRAALDGAGDDDVSLYALAQKATTFSRDDLARTFTPLATATEADWVGTFVDCFSPDYDTAERPPWAMHCWSHRYVDLNEGELQISGYHGTAGSEWGRRFDKTTDVNPVLAAGDGPAARVTSFLCKVPADAPVRADAEAGALEFVVTLGTVAHKSTRTKCLRWSTVYKGAGGKFGAFEFPPQADENFWVMVEGAEEVIGGRMEGDGYDDDFAED